MKILTVAMVPVLVLLGWVFTVVVVLGPDTDDPHLRPVACTLPAPAREGSVQLSSRQWRSVDVIVSVGRRLSVPVRGWVVAVTTAVQESGLLPLRYGDRDSLGLFQQRAAWGTKAQRLDPASATAMFYTGGHGGQPGLTDLDGWQQMPIGEAAQAVQRSAYPDAYTRWVPLAVTAVEKTVGHRLDLGCGGSDGWELPVQPGSFVITAGFGQCGDHWAHCHTGLDFAVPTGSPVYAVHDGVVVSTGDAGPYGRRVRVLHRGQVATRYAHLSRILVHPGQHVEAGQVIALSGASGNTTGPHLHLEVRRHATRHRDGVPVDPLAWLHDHGAFGPPAQPAHSLDQSPLRVKGN